VPRAVRNCCEQQNARIADTSGRLCPPRLFLPKMLRPYWPSAMSPCTVYSLGEGCPLRWRRRGLTLLWEHSASGRVRHVNHSRQRGVRLQRSCAPDKTEPGTGARVVPHPACRVETTTSGTSPFPLNCAATRMRPRCAHPFKGQGATCSTITTWTAERAA
jgi:hypothetical protein